MRDVCIYLFKYIFMINQHSQSQSGPVLPIVELDHSAINAPWRNVYHFSNQSFKVQASYAETDSYSYYSQTLEIMLYVISCNIVTAQEMC